MRFGKAWAGNVKALALIFMREISFKSLSTCLRPWAVTGKRKTQMPACRICLEVPSRTFDWPQEPRPAPKPSFKHFMVELTDPGLPAIDLSCNYPLIHVPTDSKNKP